MRRKNGVVVGGYSVYRIAVKAACCDFLEIRE